MRRLTWNLWADGPLFDDRLRVAIKTISDIGPVIFLAHGLPQGGADPLKAAPSWKRIGMREIEPPYLPMGSYSEVYASPDAEVIPLNPSGCAALAGDSLLLQVAASGDPCVVVAMRIPTHTQEPPLCLQIGSAQEDLQRMLSWVSGTDRAIFIASRRSAILEHLYDDAMGNCARRLDAWSANRPRECGFTYDGIANACANPGAKQTPDKVCANASLGPSLKRAHI